MEYDIPETITEELFYMAFCDGFYDLIQGRSLEEHFTEIEHIGGTKEIAFWFDKAPDSKGRRSTALVKIKI